MLAMMESASQFAEYGAALSRPSQGAHADPCQWPKTHVNIRTGPMNENGLV